MYRRKLTTIETKTIEQFVISVANADRGADWCADCASELLRPDDAERAHGLSLTNLRDLIKSGRIHFFETVDGHLLICRRSIESIDLNGGSE
jgi:hypothetical protein